MKIYTRTGDDGTTALFGGDRVDKHNARITAYGTVDETNATVGFARSHLSGQPGFSELDPVLSRIQHDLFVLGADLATPHGARPVVPRIDEDHIGYLEQAIDRFDGELPPLKHFILPGGSTAASALHLVRTVCRRAERLTIAAGKGDQINRNASIYLNRLSDFAFVAARWVNRQAGIDEEKWSP
jgi:cob(I)alamin adenosyltransferase